MSLKSDLDTATLNKMRKRKSPKEALPARGK